MKQLVLLVLVAFISEMASQDVSVPGNLLEVTTKAVNITLPSNVTDVEYDDETTTEALLDGDEGSVDGVEPPADSLIDARNPNCVVIQPLPPVFHPPSQTHIPVPPILNSTIDQMEREEILLCPVGSIQNGSVCITSYSNDCPEGYTWKSDRCVLSRTICPLNFEWDGRSCVERQVCPHNHIWKSGRCMQLRSCYQTIF